MPTPQPIDGYRNHLHRADWSLGEFGHGSSWTVEASRGLVRILATAPTRAEAWLRVVSFFTKVPVST